MLEYILFMLSAIFWKEKTWLDLYFYTQVTSTNKNALTEWRDMIYSYAELLMEIKAQLPKYLNYQNK